MKNIITKSSRIFIAGLTVGLLTNSCTFEESMELFVHKDLNVNVVEPVDRDFDDIKERGVLRMITRYSSNTYFLHQGIERGFEYELVSHFARKHDLAVDVVIVGPDENPYDLLNSGKGDLIAANYAITPERKQYVDFTQPHNLVNQVLIFSEELENPPSSIEGLAERGIPITVRRNSSYYHRMEKLRENGLDIPIHLVPNINDTESLLYEVSQSRYSATVADDNIFQASSQYMSGLVKGPTLAKNDTIAWAVRKNASDLKKQLNRFLYSHFRLGTNGQPPKRSTLLNVLRKRYFEGGPQIADYYNPGSRSKGSGIISPYDNMIKSIADSAGVDWLLVASIMAQETRFKPDSKSWAGAVGLMQIMPQYSAVSDVEQLFHEETNIREGVRIIKEHLDHYSYMDVDNQRSFALAAYNAGPGHVADARRVAIDHNKNPNEWENVAEALLKLMRRKYYKDARYGFSRGIETVRYVEEIKNRYRTYKDVLVLAEGTRNKRGPTILGFLN